jgi:hypothetical protein
VEFGGFVVEELILEKDPPRKGDQGEAKGETNHVFPAEVAGGSGAGFTDGVPFLGIFFGGVFVHSDSGAGYFDAPTIRTAQTPFNHYFLFISFFFGAGSHKCE